METGIVDPPEDTEKKFKSYYVVWKHKHRKNEKYSKILFKSYYVVWNPDS